MRQATYHKAHGAVGRAWYIEVQGADKPAIGDEATVIRRDGRTDIVTITEVTGAQTVRGNWVCKFKHGTTASVTAAQDAAKAIMEDGPTVPTMPEDASTVDLATLDLAEAIRRLLTAPKGVDEVAVRKIVAEALEAAKVPQLVEVTVTLVKPDETKVLLDGIRHKSFPKLLQAANAGLNVWLTGPAASGKTTGAEQVAEALGREFEICGVLLQSFDVLGFVDAMGRFQETAFYRAFKHGKVFLGDEADGWDANALLALNSALANGFVTFPNGEMVRKHKDFVCIMAANTWGLGANFDYVGRNKLDAASLDRFVFLPWEYDEAIEDAVAANPGWVAKVRSIRRAVAEKGIKVLITPRASYYGAALLAAGMDLDTVVTMTLRKGMTNEQWDSIKGFI